VTWNFVTDFGGVGDGATDNAAAFVAAIAAGPGETYIPSGVYLTSAPWVLANCRNRAFKGDGGNLVDPGTVIQYTGTDPTGLLSLRGAVDTEFSRICFKSAVNCGQILSISADNSPALSTIMPLFRHVTFSAAGVTVNWVAFIRNCVQPRFEHTWFVHANASLMLGDNVASNPNTLAQGAVGEAHFIQCYFNGDIFMRRALQPLFDGCLLDQKANGDIAGIYGNSGDQQNCNVRIVGNDCGWAQGSPRTFYVQGANSNLAEIGSNTVRYATQIADVTGGGNVSIAGNRRISTPSVANLHGLTNCVVERNPSL
jgi:hypothetical protein